jgi:hypothetical protein
MECNFCGKDKLSFWTGCDICDDNYVVCLDCASQSIDICSICFHRVCSDACRYGTKHSNLCSQSSLNNRRDETFNLSFAKKQKQGLSVKSVFSFDMEEKKTTAFLDEADTRLFEQATIGTSGFFESSLTFEQDYSTEDNNPRLFENLLQNKQDSSVFSYFIEEEKESENTVKSTLLLSRAGNGLSENSFNSVLKSDLEIGIVTWNINHFQTNISKPTAEKIEKARRMREKKKASLVRMFKQHDWLDVMVLQEINASSLNEFKSAFQVNEEIVKKLAWELGEKMTNVNAKGYTGEEEEESDDEEKDDEEEEQEDTGLTVFIDGCTYPIIRGQQEYYPIIYRTDRVTYLGSTAYQGKVKYENQREFFFWSKNRKFPGVYHQRPIIIHQLEVLNCKSKNKPINIAVVHTSPKGKGLGRQGEYEQIEEFLEFVKTDKSALWIIAGDFYLDPEATVSSNNNVKTRPQETLFKTKVAGFGLNFVVSTSATNQSRLSDKASKPREKKLARRESLKAKVLIDPAFLLKNLPKYKQKALKVKMTALRKQISEDIRKDPQNVKKYFGLTQIYKADEIDSVLRKFPDKNSHVVNKRADFFLCSNEFSYHTVGLIRPSGGLLNVDLEHYALNWWRGVSDHAPIGAVLSVSANLSKRLKIQADKEMLFKSQIDDARAKLRKIQTVALKELCEYLPKLTRAAGFILITQPELKSDGIAIARYCYYLQEVLNDSRWIDIMDPPGEVIPEDIFQDCKLEINDKCLAQILKKWNDATVKDWEIWKSKLEHCVEILRKSLRSVNTLGYTILDADFSDQDSYEKLEASLINLVGGQSLHDNHNTACSSSRYYNPNKEEEEF